MLITICALGSLPFLAFDDDFLRGFISQSQRSRDFVALRKDLKTQIREVVLLATMDKPITVIELRSLRELHLELLLLDDTELVVSPITMRFPANHPRFPGEHVLPEGVKQSQFEERLGSYSLLKGRTPNHISQDFLAARIIIYLRIGGGQRQTIRSQLDQIRNTVSKIKSRNFKFRLTGEDVISVAVVDAVQRDQIVLNSIGAILAFLVAFAVFRNIKVTLVALIPPGMGVLVTLGTFSLSGIPISVMSNVIPVLVLVLGLSNTMHLINHFLRQSGNVPFDDRLNKTIAEIGPACALTAITTAIAFAGILVSDNQLVREFAIAGSVGLILSFIVLVLAFPLLVRAAFAKSSPNGHLRDTMKFVRIPTVVCRNLTSRPKTILAAGILLAVVTGIGARYTIPWFSIYQNLPVEGGTRQASLVVDKKFGGFLRLWTEFDLSKEGGVGSRNGWKKLAAIQSGLEPAIAGRDTFSLFSLSVLLGKTDSAPRKEEFSGLPGMIFDDLAPANGKAVRIMIVTGDPMRTKNSLAAYDRLEKSAFNLGSTRITGIPTLVRHEAVSVVTQLYTGLIVVCLLSVMVIAIAFRQTILLAILPLPNLLPLLASASALWLINDGKMNPSAILALTVAFGIAVDDSIHFINRFRFNCVRSRDAREALQSTISEVGGVMVLTTALISVGLAVTVFSSFQTIQQFGILMVITLLTALVADLLLLPALLSVQRRQCQKGS